MENVRIVIAMLITFLSTIGFNVALPVRYDAYTASDARLENQEIEKQINKLKETLLLQIQLSELKMQSAQSKIQTQLDSKPPLATRERIQALEEAVREINNKYHPPSRQWNP